MIESESLNELGDSGSRQDPTNPKGGASGTTTTEASRPRCGRFLCLYFALGALYPSHQPVRIDFHCGSGPNPAVAPSEHS